MKYYLVRGLVLEKYSWQCNRQAGGLAGKREGFPAVSCFCEPKLVIRLNLVQMM